MVGEEIHIVISIPQADALALFNLAQIRGLDVNAQAVLLIHQALVQYSLVPWDPETTITPDMAIYADNPELFLRA